MSRPFCPLRVTMLAAFAVLSPGLALLPASAAQPAAPFHEATHVTVRYEGLDLGHPAGVEQLYRRLQQAAELACGPSERPGSRIRDASWKACTAQALAGAVASVDRPLLTTYHQRRTAATARKPLSERVPSTGRVASQSSAAPAGHAARRHRGRPRAGSRSRACACSSPSRST